MKHVMLRAFLLLIVLVSSLCMQGQVLVDGLYYKLSWYEAEVISVVNKNNLTVTIPNEIEYEGKNTP